MINSDLIDSGGILPDLLGSAGAEAWVVAGAPPPARPPIAKAALLAEPSTSWPW